MKSVRPLLDRLTAFFDIFDLSFFVSGAVCLGALAFLYQQSGSRLLGALQGGYLVGAVLIGCYTLGLVCFSVGRVLRRQLMGLLRWLRLLPTFPQLLEQALDDHGLRGEHLGRGKGPLLGSYLEAGRRRGRDRLYALLWAKLRQSPHLAASLAFLNRYWVMSATYDGVAVALLVWIAAMLSWRYGLGVTARPGPGTALAAGLLGLTALACWREAQRYDRDQLEELLATVAWDKIERAPAPPAPGGGADEEAEEDEDEDEDDER